MKLDEVCLQIVINSVLDIAENELEIIEILCNGNHKYLVKRHITLFNYFIENFISKIKDGSNISDETHPKLYKEFRANRWKYRQLNYEKLKNCSISGYKYGAECAICSVHKFRVMGKTHERVLKRYRNLIHKLVLTTFTIDMRFAYINANEYPLFRSQVRSHSNNRINKNRSQIKIRNRKKLNGISSTISEG